MRSMIMAMATVLMFGLGCGGALNAVADLAGVEMEMKMGDEAVHPADFPVGPPEAGTKTFSMMVVTEADKVNLPEDVDVPLEEGVKYRTEMITYQVAASDVAGLVASAKEQTTAAGFSEQPVKDKPEGSELALMANGDIMFIIVGTEERDGDHSAYVLMRIQPASPDDAAQGASPE